MMRRNRAGMARKRRSACRPIRGQRGDMLIEILVAVAILGVVAVAFLSALLSGYLALVLADEKTMAESLTRTELEHVRNAEYPVVSDNHTPVAGYDVVTYAVYTDPVTYLPTTTAMGRQEVTVEVWHQGELVLVTVTYKVRL